MADKGDPWSREKQAAAAAAALLVEEGMRVGIGSGSTVARFISALGRRHLEVRCVTASPESRRLAEEAGLRVDPFDVLDRLDIAADGADQVAPDLWLVKGGGGAHTREKVVAAAARRFVVIVSPNKLVDRLEPPVPLEVLGFGLGATLRRLRQFGPVEERPAPRTPDGHRLVDYLGEVDDPVTLAAAFDQVPGVISHGLFPPHLTSEVLIGRRDGTTDRRGR